jgi:ribosomal protein S18 acetylase RimI-like enzyme
MVSYRQAAVDEPAAHALLAEYFHSRDLGFVGGDYVTVFPTPANFEPPVGVFLIVRLDGTDVGCGGIRRLDAGSSERDASQRLRFEVKHLWLQPQTRGKGLGRALLLELESRAIAFGADELVLDTNASLTAAAGLYRSTGFVGIEPYNDNPNATNWYLKKL